LRKPVRCLKVWWPMIRIDQWVKYLASHQPRLLLGGQLPDPNGKWKEMFSKFWSDYKVLNGDHPIFHRGDVDLGACLPYFIHGDEGRGQLKRPYMVVSIQLAIGHGGPEVCNDTGLSPLKEWENPTESAAWRSEGPGDPPFKSFSYMLQIPGSHAPKYITLDYLHIYHLGYGMDASASSIVSGNTFPTTVGGKAFDVGLIMAWLEDDL
ncbi:Uncharacterized protein SCF082_LOCUS31509, partial [Durusdinium trenchii]